MARTRHVVHTAVPRERAFAFVGDLRNAPAWDPQALGVDKLTPGPIAVGTRFLLTASVARVRLELPYEVRAHEPGRRLVLEGETRLVRYRDEIRFEDAEGGG